MIRQINGQRSQAIADLLSQKRAQLVDISYEMRRSAFGSRHSASCVTLKPEDPCKSVRIRVIRVRILRAGLLDSRKRHPGEGARFHVDLFTCFAGFIHTSTEAILNNATCS